MVKVCGVCVKPIYTDEATDTVHRSCLSTASQQRDELLAALKRIDALADGWHGPAAGIQDVARAAIAKMGTK